MFNFFYGLLVVLSDVFALVGCAVGWGVVGSLIGLGHLGIVELDIQLPDEIGLPETNSYKQNRDANSYRS